MRYRDTNNVVRYARKIQNKIPSIIKKESIALNTINAILAQLYIFFLVEHITDKEIDENIKNNELLLHEYSVNSFKKYKITVSAKITTTPVKIKPIEE